MRLLLLLVFMHIASTGAFAGSTPDLESIAFEQKPGALLPLRAAFNDESGRVVRLSELFSGRPLALVLGYFHCRRLCSVVRANLLGALRGADLVAGRDYALAALSIDASETPKDAAAAKAEDARSFGPAGATYWAYLTGDADSIRRVAAAVGFRSLSAQTPNFFAHSVGVVFVAPSGSVSNYLLGAGYRPEDVRMALQRAASGEVAPASSPILLLCFDYDATTGRHTLAVMKVLRIAAALFVLLLVGLAIRAALAKGSQA